MLTRKGRIFAYVSLPFLIITFFLLVVPLAILIAYFTKKEIALNDFENQLVESIPEDVELIKIDSLNGSFNASGKGNAYLSVALFESELSLETLQDYYKNYSFENAQPDAYPTPSDFYQVSSYVSKVDFLPIETIFTHDARNFFFFENVTLEDFKNIYYVAIFDESYSV